MAYCRKCAHWIETRKVCNDCGEPDRVVELEAKNQKLQRALDLMSPRCESLHHSRKQYHTSREECPVEKLVREAREGEG